MIVWDDGRKIEIGDQFVTALKALAVGYEHIRPLHAAFLRTFNFCYRGADGYVITPQGRNALEIWERGHEYDCAKDDRKHPDAAGSAAVHVSGAGQ